MPLRMNPYTGRYEYYDEDDTEVQNPYTGEYEVGNPEAGIGYGVFTRRYRANRSKEMCEKFNPYTREYEYVPCDWELTFNPYTRRYEFAPKE